MEGIQVVEGILAVEGASLACLGGLAGSLQPEGAPQAAEDSPKAVLGGSQDRTWLNGLQSSKANTLSFVRK